MNHPSDRIGSSTVEFSGEEKNLVHAQMQRVLNDPLFSGSRRYCDLLGYIVETTLEERTDNLKERVIGAEVFGKEASYDTSADPTVRVAASSIRKRLAKYYAAAEHQNELRIEIPVRSYVATFHFPEPEGSAASDAVVEPTPAESPVKRGHRIKLPFTGRAALVFATAALLLAAGMYSYRLVQRSMPINQFWSPVLSNDDAFDILVGSPLDSTWPLPPSAASVSKSEPLASDEIVKVGMMDMNAAVDLADFVRSKGKVVTILPAPITWVEHRTRHSFALYGRFQQEWIAQLGTDLRLRFRKDPNQDLRWIEDSEDPRNHSWATHFSTPDDKLAYDYAVISRIHDNATNHWWIGIAGLTGIGTKVANRIVVDPKEMAAIGPYLPKGWTNKNIQILLAIKLANATAGDIHVVTVKCW